MKKRVLSLLMVFCMLFSLFPAGVMAEENEIEPAGLQFEGVLQDDLIIEEENEIPDPSLDEGEEDEDDAVAEEDPQDADLQDNTPIEDSMVEETAKLPNDEYRTEAGDEIENETSVEEDNLPEIVEEGEDACEDEAPVTAQACTHPDMEHHAKVDATCKKAGNIEYWHCPDCGKFFSDEAATTEINQSDTVIPKLTHVFGPDYKCIYCKALLLDYLGNNYDEVSNPSLSPKIAHYGCTYSSIYHVPYDETIPPTVVLGDGTNQWVVPAKDPETGRTNFTMKASPDGMSTIITFSKAFIRSLTKNATYYVAIWNGTDYISNILDFRVSAALVTSGADLPEGYCGENAKWELNEGVLTISGTGAIADYSSPVTSSSSEEIPAPWGTDVFAVIIADGITHIGNYAFAYCLFLSSVSIPDSVTTIGSYAFKNCSSLQNLQLPCNLEGISDGLFDQCTSLNSIDIPESVTYIGMRAFGSTSITNIRIPAGVYSIGYYSYADISVNPFANCENLSRIEVDPHNEFFTEFDNMIISRDGTTLICCPGGVVGTVQLPDNLLAIQGGAFYGCSKLIEITLPETVYSIGEDMLYSGVFAFCTSLRHITIPHEISTIPASAFQGCISLESIYLPESVCSIELRAFEGCVALTEVYFGGPRGDWENIYFAEYNEPLLNATVHCLTIDPTRFQHVELFAFNTEYLVLSSVQGQIELPVNLVSDDDEIYSYIEWSTESGTDDVISVDSGLITAMAPGTDHVIATLSDGLNTLTARCRIDVLDEAWQAENRYEINLPILKVTSEIYSLKYAEIPVVISLAQNMVTAAGVETADGTYLEDTGIMITEATFESGAIQKVFGLRIKDDRTLEIIPIIDLNSASAVKAVKGSYKSKINLTLEDGTEFVTPEITLSVKKTLPKLKAAAVKLNRFIDGDSAKIVITGGTVESFEANELPFAALSDDLTVALKEGLTKNTSGKYTLDCVFSDWAVPAKVTVSVSAAYTAPKVVLKPASLTLNPNLSDEATAVVTVTPLPEMEHEISLDTGTSGLSWDYDDGKLTVSKGSAVSGTYKLPVMADGKQVALLTVKVLSGTPAVTLTAKAAGSIDTAVPFSPVTITVTGKNFNAAAGEYSLRILQEKKGNASAVVLDEKSGIDTGLFQVSHDANVLTVTAGEDLSKYVTGYTYTATVSSEYGEAKPVKLTVKTSAKQPQPSATLKAKGSIDVLRPGTFVTLTPTFKNWYGYDLSTAKLNLEDSVFAWEYVDGAFIIAAKAGANIDAKAAHTVSMTLDGKTTATVKIPVKMGSAKVAQDVKAITLARNDRYDRQSVVLSMSDESLYHISTADVVLSDKSGNFKLTPLGNGEYAIGFKDNLLPKNVNMLKSATVQLLVYLRGNGSHTFNGRENGTKNAAVSVKISLTGTYVEPKPAPEPSPTPIVAPAPTVSPTPSVIEPKEGGSRIVFTTGGEAGTYYGLGSILAQEVSKVTSTRVTAITSGGSSANIDALDIGDAQLGISQSDVLAYAYTGARTFEDIGAITSFSIVAPLYQEQVQIVTLNPNIKTVADLRGKTISIGAAGSGIYFNALDILGSYGLTVDDIRATYQSFSDASEALRDGQIDAAFIVAGAPATAVASLASSKSVYLVSMDDEHIDTLTASSPYYIRSVIPAGTYGMPEDAATVAVSAVVIAGKSVSNVDVYNFLYGVFENVEDLSSQHSKAQELNLQFAASYVSIPYHSGAVQYYTDKGLTVPSQA